MEILYFKDSLPQGFFISTIIGEPHCERAILRQKCELVDVHVWKGRVQARNTNTGLHSNTRTSD